MVNSASKSPRRDEGVDDPALAGQIGIGHGLLALHAAARTACELARRLGRAIDDPGDLVERNREHVMEHERKPLRGAQRIEHDEQRRTDRLGEHRLALDIVVVGHRLGNLRRDRLLAARLARAQHVEADTCDDGRQPAAEVLDLRRVGAAQPQPGFLDGILGLRARAEHAVGDCAQVCAVRLEAFGQKFLLVHRHIPAWRSVITMTNEPAPV
jgi:hypothetical protein